MNREARLICIGLAAAMIGGLVGCARKPAYSDMDPNNRAGNQNQNRNQSAEGHAAATPPAEGHVAATPPATGHAAATPPAEGKSSAQPRVAEQPIAPSTPQPPPPPAFKSPSFVDLVKGEIKDLPSYPRAQRIGAQIGPVQGANTMSLALQTSDPMDKITAFYEQAIKTNKWTVIDKIIDPELSEWNLKKGDLDNGKVQVKKDQRTNQLNIVIVRTEKVPEPPKPEPPK